MSSRLLRVKPKLRKAIEEVSRKNKIKFTDAGELIAEAYNLNKDKKILEKQIREWSF